MEDAPNGAIRDGRNQSRQTVPSLGVMKAVIKARPEPGLEMASIPIPVVQPNEVLVKVLATSICGTDRLLYEWTPWAQQRCKGIPFVQGHEMCGEVVEKGARVRSLNVGDRISAESHIVDYDGEYFLKGLGHVAPETSIIGVDRDGAFAEYIALPWQNARRNPAGMPLKVAVLKENFGNAVHVGYAVELEGRDVLITGAGPAGLMTLLVARARGARRIFASDISKYRLDFARRLGADEVIDPGRESLFEKVMDLTQGRGVDVLLEIAGAERAIADGLGLVRAGGHAVAFGLPKGPIRLDLSELVIFKGVTLHGVVGRRLWDTWERMEHLLESGRVDLTPIVTHEYPLSEYERAFRTMNQGECGKVMMRP